MNLTTTRAHWVIFTKSFVVAMLALVCLATIRAESGRPNVLLIYTDDHRFSGVHALGGEPVQTPNLDRLAADGVVFTHAYLMGSFVGATCIPSRASLQTGRSLFQLQGNGSVIPPANTTLGEAFHQAGYQTHIIGKWHQDKASLSRSFESGETIMGLGAYLVDHYRMPLWDWDETGKYMRESAYLLEYDQNGKTVRRPLSSADKQGPIGTERTGPHTSKIYADSAVHFLRTHDRQRPFFVYLAFHAPHDPRQSPQKYRDLYPPDKIKLPPSYLPQHPFDNGHMVLRDEELAPWPRTPEVARQQLADYYAAISYLDGQIGRVIAELKATGQYTNTLIVMAGDSGLAVGCHGLMGKQNIYDEDGIHVPLIFSGGVIKEHHRKEPALCYLHDIFPTVCDLAGVPIPKSVTGVSLAPVITQRTAPPRESTYHAYTQFQRAYRKGDYKLIEYVRAPGRQGKQPVRVSGSRVTQLFNYATDPWETADLSFRPEYQERIDELRHEMRAAAKALDDRPESVGQEFDFWDYYDCPTNLVADLRK